MLFKSGRIYFILSYFLQGAGSGWLLLSDEIPVPPKLRLRWGRVSPNGLTGLVGAKLFLLERANCC